MTTVKINLRNNAVTQYGGFPFVSFCKFMGRPLGAGQDGIFVLDGAGDKDVFTPTADERSVAGWFELPLSKLGVPAVKRCRQIQVNGEFAGDLTLTARTTGEAIVEKQYVIPTKNELLIQNTALVRPSRTQQAEDWQFIVSSPYGADFSIDAIIGLFDVVARRLGR